MEKDPTFTPPNDDPSRCDLFKKKKGADLIFTQIKALEKREGDMPVLRGKVNALAMGYEGMCIRRGCECVEGCRDLIFKQLRQEAGLAEKE